MLTRRGETRLFCEGVSQLQQICSLTPRSFHDSRQIISSFRIHPRVLASPFGGNVILGGRYCCWWVRTDQGGTTRRPRHAHRLPPQRRVGPAVLPLRPLLVQLRQQLHRGGEDRLPPQQAAVPPEGRSLVRPDRGFPSEGKGLPTFGEARVWTELEVDGLGDLDDVEEPRGRRGGGEDAGDGWPGAVRPPEPPVGPPPLEARLPGGPRAFVVRYATAWCRFRRALLVGNRLVAAAWCRFCSSLVRSGLVAQCECGGEKNDRLIIFLLNPLDTPRSPIAGQVS